MAGLVTKIGFATAGLLWAGACAAETTRTFNKFIPATHPYQVHIMDVWAKDVAAATGISASNAGVRVFRAREALRKQVARSCGTCAEHGCLDCTCGAPAQAHGSGGHGCAS